MLVPENIRGVSKRHCKIVMGKKGWAIQDMGSANKTLIKDGNTWHTVESYTTGSATILRQGDLIYLGRDGHVVLMVETTQK